MHSKQTSVSQKVLVAYACLVAAVLGLHFTATAIFLQPANPLRDRLYPLTSAYLGEYFMQNWRLFAPEPMEPSKRFWVSCRIEDRSGKVIATEPQDISAPHYAALHATRLSPSQRLLRAQLYPLTFVHPPTDEFVDALIDFRDESDPKLRAIGEAVAKAQQTAREDGLDTLARVASVECARRYPAARTTSVGILYSHEKAPPFSKRNEPRTVGKVERLDYGWHDFQRVAAY